MPFMLTYAAVDYSYFALAMSFDKRKAREAKFQDSTTKSLLSTTVEKSKSESSDSLQNGGQSLGYGAVHKNKGDLDNLFPERVQHDQQGRLKRQNSLNSPTSPGSKDPNAVKSDSISVTSETDSKYDDTSELLEKKGIKLIKMFV